MKSAVSHILSLLYVGPLLSSYFKDLFFVFGILKCYYNVSRMCFFLVIFLVNLLCFVYLWLYIFPENSQVLSVQILSTIWFLSCFLLRLLFDMYSVILSSKTVNLSVIILYSSLCAILGYLLSFALQLFLFSAVSNLLFNQYIKVFFFFPQLYCSFLKFYFVLFIIWSLFFAHFFKSPFKKPFHASLFYVLYLILQTSVILGYLNLMFIVSHDSYGDFFFLCISWYLTDCK